MDPRPHPQTKQMPSLPTNHAFVVQFRASTEDESLQCDGRVEHLVSGQAIKFHSWQQLQAFIAQVLTCLSEKPP